MITISLKIFGQFSWFPTQVSLSLPFLTLVFSVPGARCSAAAPRYSPTKTHMHFESLVKKSWCVGREAARLTGLGWSWPGQGSVYRQDITWAAPRSPPPPQDRHNDQNNLITSPTLCNQMIFSIPIGFYFTNHKLSGFLFLDLKKKT